MPSTKHLDTAIAILSNPKTKRVKKMTLTILPPGAVVQDHRGREVKRWVQVSPTEAKLHAQGIAQLAGLPLEVHNYGNDNSD